MASSARQSWQTLPSLHPPLLSNQTPWIRERLQQAGRTKHWEEQSGLRGRRGDINAFLIRENRVVRLHSNLLVALRGGTGYHRFHFRSLIRLMKHEEKSAQSFLKGKKRRKPKQINPNTMLGQRSCLQIKSDAGWRENSNQIKPSQCWNGCV